MGPKSWPKEERPREKLLQYGAETLSDAELLTIIIGTSSVHGLNVYELSMKLVESGGLSQLDSMTVGSMMELPGIGPAKAAVLKAAFEAGRRSLAAAVKKNRSPEVPIFTTCSGENCTIRTGKSSSVCSWMPVTGL